MITEVYSFKNKAHKILTFSDEIVIEYDSSTCLITFVMVNSYAFKVPCERLKLSVFGQCLFVVGLFLYFLIYESCQVQVPLFAAV